MDVVSCMQEVGLPVVSSSCCHNLEAWREVHLSSSGVLLIPYPLISGIFLVFGAAPKYAYKIVVTIPHEKQACILPARLRGANIVFGKGLVGREVSGWSLLRFRINCKSLHPAAHSRTTGFLYP